MGNLFSNVSVAYSYHHQGIMIKKHSCIYKGGAECANSRWGILLLQRGGCQWPRPWTGSPDDQIRFLRTDCVDRTELQSRFKCRCAMWKGCTPSYIAEVLVRIVIMHPIPCFFSMFKEGQHILKEVEFVECVDARAIAQMAWVEKIIPEAVEI